MYAEHVAVVMQILASAALLGGEGFPAAHGPAAAHVLGACMGTLNERGTLLVTPQSPIRWVVRLEEVLNAKRMCVALAGQHVPQPPAQALKKRYGISCMLFLSAVVFSCKIPMAHLVGMHKACITRTLLLCLSMSYMLL